MFNFKKCKTCFEYYSSLDVRDVYYIIKYGNDVKKFTVEIPVGHEKCFKKNVYDNAKKIAISKNIKKKITDCLDKDVYTFCTFCKKYIDKRAIELLNLTIFVEDENPLYLIGNFIKHHSKCFDVVLRKKIIEYYGKKIEGKKISIIVNRF